MIRFLFVCFAGAVGTGARYLLSGSIARSFGPVFPYGTLTVNTIGSFLLPLIMEVSLKTAAVSPDLRVILTTGFLGGFTTYSTFNYETLNAMQQGGWGLGVLNIVATVVVCLVAGVLGLWTGRAIAGP